ncbi:DUF3823 domain-containing protein [Chitinophaga arvensicola]|uniref:DUF3823 domain-containing protein n=1 Tax=Chitinophaga arvensicola TaxID=29529 RepID=A0A1I0SBU3_9BACT|nr:DUF3823 domain-containing protein [Chitinophaga arvensicola]SEW54043.1 Protein of unknown function [Chitinophaga arvensicola]
MKTSSYYTLFVALGLLFASCKKDNYKAPSSTFSGRLVYQGEPINVGFNDVYFELWEPGWGKSSAIPMSVSQDGAFSALLFNGHYKVIIPASQGPFRSLSDKTTNTDTMLLTVSGNIKQDIEVMPYYMIRSPKFTTTGKELTATFRAEKIIKDVNARDIEKVALYVCKTQFVNPANSIKSKEVSAADIADPANISLQLTIPDVVPLQKTVFARVAIKIAGVEDMLYSPVQEINL